MMWTKKAVLIESVIILGLLAGMTFNIPSTNADAKEPDPSQCFFIEEIVHNEILVIRTMEPKPQQGDTAISFVDPTESLIYGLKEVGKEYKVKQIQSINQKWKNGSFTSAMIILVEPKKPH